MYDGKKQNGVGGLKQQHKKLDRGWFNLMKEAEAIGLTPKEVERFLQERQKVKK
ncbi:anti-repressor SinI family protein [Alkalibacillus haloalkaliphilus]|uniref:anti-repressor SinI family protein n=1 Tax=Alkalibacillus haloalkaliphilus TaxID=94136 RepID=UPI0029354F2D|nr:anti-repressor SinI family protein [Alkalibacillus haloalkaliphilus]MDV2582953.1 anti-repressor SinI family protein [Alkalibacillus haloalkaliphilus]